MTERTDSKPPQPPGGDFSAMFGRRARVGAIAAVVVAAGLGGWLLTRGGDEAEPSADPRPGQTLTGIPPGTQVGPTTVDAVGIGRTARALGQSVYWLGALEGYAYEIERTGQGWVIVRYLPGGEQASRPNVEYLAVATYPFDDALDALRKVGEKGGNEIVPLEGGGIAVVGKAHPKSVYVAYPGVDYEVEVYAPDQADARRFVESGDLQLAN